MTASVHRIAQAGFGEGTNDLYDRARPTYPALALQHIHAALPARPLNILELGAGTGLFTRLLLAPPPPSETLPSREAGSSADDAGGNSPAYPKWEIGSLVAVDPSAGMRAQFDKSLAPLIQASGADVRALPGGFHDLADVRAEMGREWRADLVVIAQAWHWCHPEYGRAIEEIGSMLAPGGIIVLIWNFERLDRPFTRLIKELELGESQDSPQYIKGLWKGTFDTPEYLAAFEPDVVRNVWWDIAVDDQYVLDRSFSKSFIAIKSPGEKEAHKAKLLEILGREDSGKEWVDKEKGKFIYPFNTELHMMRKKGGS